MKLLNFLKATTPGNRAALRDKGIFNRTPRHNRSTRRCSTCGGLEPTYRLIHPKGRRVQLCPACRTAELENAVL